jgi:hypothetical protein
VSGREVVLTIDECRRVALEGVDRQLSALAQGRNPDTHGEANGAGWDRHIVGAGGEYAVAKTLGVFWKCETGAINLRGDVVDRVQVRATRHRNGYLNVWRDDPDDHTFVLVAGSLPRLVIAGFMLGRDAKAERYWDETRGRPSFKIPQADLEPFLTRAEREAKRDG